MDKRNWQIIYSNYEGPQKRAVELISREIGGRILRDKGVYSYHVLPCKHEEVLPASNVIVLGTFRENSIIRKYMEPEKPPHNGYVVKVMDHPQTAGCKLVLLCGYSSTEVFYAAADFTDDYLAKAIPSFDACIHLEQELFINPLPDYVISTSPDFQTRSVFTWGHPINDYKAYLEDMARMKLNQVIIWNDFLPVNAKDVVEYAHSYGIEVIWGFAWGWSQKCAQTDIHDLENLSDRILEEYHRTWQGACGDGIYFQSFTELPFDTIDGVSIAEAVTELVNMTAGKILEENPKLHIQFGLHASSVREHLEDISGVDDRVEIVWEDCGAFPFKAADPGFAAQFSEEAYQKKQLFSESILNLREKGNSGIVYKCQLTMDWSRNRVKQQAGPYVMGEMSEEMIKEDDQLISYAWRYYCTKWLEHGPEAYRITRHILEKSDGKANMCLAGMFSGGVWFPTALCAQMFWNCREPYNVIQEKVLLRKRIRF